MITCNSVEQLRLQVKTWREAGETIAFVPTMGNLHAGHLSLVDIAKQNATKVIVSIYVNPLQFAPDEDFASYPRTLDADIEKLEQHDADLIFTPDSLMIYPQGEQRSSYVEVPELSNIVEGEFRPGFFKGVATVVLKLFNMVQPDIAVFGEKDFQQLLVIRQMVVDLNLAIDVIGGETRREPDGLAMSSRNNYLSESDRKNSAHLSVALLRLKTQIEQGVGVESAEASCVEMLEGCGFVVDYVTLRETKRLDKVSNDDIRNNVEIIALAAAKMGKTRLIDNLKFFCN